MKHSSLSNTMNLIFDGAEEKVMRGGGVMVRSMTSVALAATMLVGLGACAKDEIPRTFKTPELAVEALAKALEGDDPAEVEALFGPGSLEHLRSGDEVSDREDIAQVRKLIAEKVTFEDVDESAKMANFGNDAWPFPFPLIANADGKWRFDLAGGIQELHNRRIGANELDTLASLHAYVDAQREYFTSIPDGSPPRFAQKFMSDEGTKNGLYWPTAEGEEPSPLGDLFAVASGEGYFAEDEGEAGDDDGDPEAYHGYHYRILTGQGANAPGGGARSYLDDKGLMRTGFAAVAWPASYGNSGIMTFIVNQRGIVYQKDLGNETPVLAAAITAYDPDSSWQPTGD
jgi:hypothetical protein